MKNTMLRNKPAIVCIQSPIETFVHVESNTRRLMECFRQDRDA